MDCCKYKECPYYNEHGKYLPIGLESHKSKVLLVFQAPGKDEWKGNNSNLGRVPVSSTTPHSAGKRIMNSLDRIGKNRNDFDFVETVRCYPGKKTNGRDNKPRQSAIKLCINHLAKDIESNKYKKIICFGKIASNAVKPLLENNNSIEMIVLPHPTGHLSNDKLDRNLRREKHG